MPKTIEFEGTTHEFPDDFTDSDISTALATAHPATGSKPSGNFFERALRPVDQALTEGSHMMYEGGKALWNEPTWERKAHGLSQALRGAGTVMSPALVPAAMANPVGTAVRLGTGLAAQGVTEGIGKTVGVPEGYSELAGDVAGLGTASRVPATLAGVQQAAQTVGRTVKGAAQGAAQALVKKPIETAALAAAGHVIGGPQGAAIGTALGTIPGAIEGGLRGYRNAPSLPPPRPQVAPPPIQGSNAPPLIPRSQVAAPPIQGSNAPPIIQRPQVAAPPIQGWNEPPPEPVRQTAAPPPIQYSKPAKAAPKPPGPAGPVRGPKLPVKWNPTPEEPLAAEDVATEAAMPPNESAATGSGLQPPPAIEPNAVTSQPGGLPKMVTSDAVRQSANSAGISEAEAQRQIAANGYQILNRGELFRMTHGFPGMDHAALQDIARIKYGVDSMAKLTEDQMLELYQDLASKQGVKATGTPKTPRKMKFAMAEGGVVVPKGKKAGRMSKRGVWYGPKGSKPQIPHYTQ